MGYGKTVHVEVGNSNVVVVVAPKQMGIMDRIYQRRDNEIGPFSTIPGPTNCRSFRKGRWTTRKHNDRGKHGILTR